MLYAHLSFLAGTNFLLKVEVEGDQISTQLIADNKLQIINYYQKLIITINLVLLLLGSVILAGVMHLVYRRRLLIKIWWQNLTSKKYKKLNPKGVSDDKLCQVCYFNCRNVLFYKCRHLIVC